MKPKRKGGRRRKRSGTMSVVELLERLGMIERPPTSEDIRRTERKYTRNGWVA